MILPKLVVITENIVKIIKGLVSFKYSNKYNLFGFFISNSFLLIIIMIAAYRRLKKIKVMHIQNSGLIMIEILKTINNVVIL